jgi:hypothetical protein
MHRNHQGFTPLDLACFYDNEWACGELVRRSCSWARHPLTGYEPLAFCLRFNKPRCARVLWSERAMGRDAPDGRTLFAWATQAHRDHPEIFLWLGPFLVKAERALIEKALSQKDSGWGEPLRL